MDNEQIYDSAIKHFGMKYQIDIAIEEMAELTKELIKYKRGFDNKKNVQEEIADVQIMVFQMMMCFDNGDDIYKILEEKTQRLKRIVEGWQC